MQTNIYMEAMIRTNFNSQSNICNKLTTIDRIIFFVFNESFKIVLYI
jgi:hypothetical protein